MVEYFDDNDVNIISIQSGKYHTLAIDSKYNVYSWGDNQYGQCGHGTCHDIINAPKLIVKLQGHQITSIDCARISFSLPFNWRTTLVVWFQWFWSMFNCKNVTPQLVDDQDRIRCICLGTNSTIVVLDDSISIWK